VLELYAKHGAHQTRLRLGLCEGGISMESGQPGSGKFQKRFDLGVGRAVGSQLLILVQIDHQGKVIFFVASEKLSLPTKLLHPPCVASIAAQ
jgi:hypothetical protein